MKGLEGDADAVLAELSETLSSARTVEQLTRPLLELLELVSGLDSTYLTRVDETAGVQTILYSRNSRSLRIPEGLVVPWGDTLCKRALDEGRAYTDDVDDCWGDSDAARALGIQTYASMPVRLDDGSLFGTLCAASARRKPLSSRGQQILALFAALIAQAVERERLLDGLRQANARLADYSYVDALTGLPNRRAILRDLRGLFAQAGRDGRGVMVAFIDLDGFKGINDRLGHDIGDAFLVEMGRRLAEGLREGDRLGRLGGDEFVVVGVADGVPEDVVRGVRNRLTPLTAGRYDLNGHCLDYAGASVGVICADAVISSPEQALREADAAMYVDKMLRKGVI